ncbi:type III secretion system cytoplasmic ring protein SctQ [Ideonella sp. DXS29W]|uniref:Type III secretion system cytoplasmic ring protein SctQ n=1 Tax=Ideonella lacteola TaxID=2984193 RepID=A0ABU9BJW7_9BURK
MNLWTEPSRAVNAAQAAPSPAAVRSLADALPRRALGQAAAARLCHDTRMPACLQRWLPGVAVQVGRATSTSPDRRWLRLGLCTLAGDLTIDVDPHADPRWALIGDLAQREADRPLACAMATELIRRAAQQRGIDTLGLAVDRLQPDGEASPDQPALHLDGHELRVHSVDDAFGLFVAEELPKSPAIRPPALHRLRLATRLVIGPRPVRARVWRSIEPGDVWLLSAPPVGGTWHAGHGCGWGGAASIEGPAARLVLTSALHPLDHTPPMDDTTLLSSETADTADLAGEIELPICFEIDTARLRLDDISAMAPGHVIALDVPLAEAPVRLVCHGQRVGRGRLIAIGDRLGVQIERISDERGLHAGH